MACNIVKTASGVTVIACGPRGAKRCAYCTRPHTKLCDFVVDHKPASVPEGTMEKPVTCDKPLCGQCARNMGPDKDHCRIHADRGDKEVA